MLAKRNALSLFLVLTLLSSYGSAAALSAATIIEQLASFTPSLSPGTQVFLKSDPGFKNETARWTLHDPPTYIVAVQPTLESDVQKIVKFATALKIPFLATGGGHGFATTFARLQNGIEINLASFNTVTVDQSAQTMTIGGSVIFANLIEPLYNAGFELPIGSQPCVGAVGATLGGGVGRYNGLHGMLADTLKSVRMVTANGDCVTVSASENSDLFWGMRGAGFNFGIVVSATYNVAPLTNGGQVMNADFLFLPNQSVAVFNYFASKTVLPAELSLIFQTGFNADLGGTYIVVNAIYAGPVEEGTALVQGLIDAHPLRQNITEISWNSINQKAFFGSASATCSKNGIQNVYGLGIKTYDVQSFQTYFENLQRLFVEHPSTQKSVFFIEAFPIQAVQAIDVEETAYPWRDITAHLLFVYGYDDIAVEDIVNSFAIDARTQLSANNGLIPREQIYVSYAHGDEKPEVLYSAQNLSRLRRLKRRWDPRGVFSFNVPF